MLVNTTDVLVRDLMKDPVSVKEGTTIGETLELLKKEKIILVPVTDKDNVLIRTVTASRSGGASYPGRPSRFGSFNFSR